MTSYEFKEEKNSNSDREDFSSSFSESYDSSDTEKSDEEIK